VWKMTSSWTSGPGILDRIDSRRSRGTAKLKNG
jgi:hypothetical protein